MSIIPAMGHAASGAAGSAISAVVTHPLDLATARAKGQLLLLGSGGGGASALATLRSIYQAEGGLRALYAGLRADVVESAAEGFLFFLFYAWFKAQWRKTTMAGNMTSAAAGEFVVGAAAAACVRLLATVTARTQMRTLPEERRRAEPRRNAGAPRRPAGRLRR